MRYFSCFDSNSNSLASIQFDSLKFNQNSCIQRSAVITMYSFLESDVLLKYDPHNFGVRRGRSFISPYFGDPDVIKVSFLHTLTLACNNKYLKLQQVSLLRFYSVFWVSC